MSCTRSVLVSSYCTARWPYSDFNAVSVQHVKTWLPTLLQVEVSGNEVRLLGQCRMHSVRAAPVSHDDCSSKADAPYDV